TPARVIDPTVIRRIPRYMTQKMKNRTKATISFGTNDSAPRTKSFTDCCQNWGRTISFSVRVVSPRIADIRSRLCEAWATAGWLVGWLLACVVVGGGSAAGRWANN